MNTKDVKLNVKDKSVAAYLNDNTISKNTDNRCSIDDRSPYYLMKDILYFKNSAGFIKGDILKIEMEDRAQGSGKGLVNTYYYEAATYDDVSTEMILVHFEVKAI